MQEARRTKVAVCVVAAAFALAGCGNGGDGSDGKHSPSASPTQTDPYQKAPWRLQVVNLLSALHNPGDGKYRNWLSDDPTYDTRDFTYTPRRTGDPGWEKRNYGGTAVVYPGTMKPTEKKAFFNALTRDNTVIPGTLTVVDPKGETVTGDNSYMFTFKVKTTRGNWLTGTAIGGPGTSAAKGHITELAYDVKPSS
ncbi:hypothetical protein [Streptomyces alanosinicus]|uniref:Lipoprotein n=1 Tax=Streptomyces alanosinicus TaxID=68171 RepID=A0A918YLG9_9ACTN|nr:hypothetical protein [Streptomyces alanosinicus]GHE07349.1 hypothetical protein GCM10010339_52090 [Streptomyces alanosinicus]